MKVYVLEGGWEYEGWCVIIAGTNYEKILKKAEAEAEYGRYDGLQIREFCDDNDDHAKKMWDWCQ